MCGPIFVLSRPPHGPFTMEIRSEPKRPFAGVAVDEATTPQDQRDYRHVVADG